MHLPAFLPTYLLNSPACHVRRTRRHRWMLSCALILTLTSRAHLPAVPGMPAVQEGRAWVDAVMARDFDTVIPAHASAPVRDGKAAFAGCFDFLY